MTGLDLATLELAKDYTDNKFNLAIGGFDIKFVENQPSVGDSNVIYFIYDNITKAYKQYMYYNGSWKNITSVSFPNAISQSDMEAYCNGTFMTTINGKLTALQTSMQQYVDDKFDEINTEVEGVLNGQY